MSVAPVLVILTAGGLETARRIQAALPEAELRGLAGRAEGAERVFRSASDELQSLFRDQRPIIGLCAAGILIRALAPLLQDKTREPPVVAVAEDGGAVVPLLGGHHGGNALAARLGEILGVTPAVTTAGERHFGLALDDPPPGWRLYNRQHYKGFVARLLAGDEVCLEGEAAWLRDGSLPISDEGALTIRITERAAEGAPERLVYHPRCLAVGLGCERGADPDEAVALVRSALSKAGLAEGAVAGIFSIDLKSDEPAVLAAAQALGVPARFFNAPALERERERLANPSDLVFREVGCHGVAEGAALAAAGPAGELIVAKTKSRRATCAVARAHAPVEALAVGRGRGSLAVVGLGPGGDAWRTPEAETALRQATDLVGYRLYLDLAGPLVRGKRLHAFGLGEEQARVRVALDHAAQGRDVALVCSGDPGIYAMAALVFEEIELGGRADWARVAVSVVPGISALQAAAARIGAPLGHDFCAVSLSDLLTPSTAIERRLRAAAEGDFVLALYNPVSGKRRQLLGRAVEILSAQRPPDTPVVLARNLGRDGEAVSVIRLDGLSAEQVDMLTVVLIGASTTRRLARGDGGCWVYTPRGYAAKASSEDAA